MSKALMYVLLVSGLLLAVAPALDAQGNNANFRAHLSSPDAVDSNGQGQAIFKLNNDGTSIQYKLIVANIENVTMAHIHLAEVAGGNGPPVVWLYPAAPPPVLIEGRSDGVIAAGVITSANLVGPLSGMTLSELVQAIDDGRTYVNVHTSAYPGGEIRGDIF